MTQQYDFDSPSMGGWTAKDNAGRLCLFENIGHLEKVNTSFGESDAVRADVTVIDAPGGPIEFPNSLIFGKAMAPTVARSAGRKLLGRVGQGTPPRPGQDPPWILIDTSDPDKAMASQYIKNRDAGQFASPNVPQAGPPVATPMTPPPPTPQQGQMVDVSQLSPEQLAAILNAGK